MIHILEKPLLLILVLELQHCIQIEYCPKRARTTIVIELIKRNGPINATPLTSKLLLIVAPTKGKKPYKPGREKTAYKIAEKNQFSEALKISKPSDKIIPSFNDNEGHQIMSWTSCS